jgi:hypothetical protein
MNIFEPYTPARWMLFDVPMKRLILKFVPLLLAFICGVLAKTLWDRRAQILDIWSNLFLYYQD